MSDSTGDDRVAQFTQFRKRMNERILAEPNQVVRRFFALDTQTYQAGALDVKTKELLGLVASLVLRCDDCISYHVAQCKEAGVSRDEMFETFSVGLVVGGSIVIPGSARSSHFGIAQVRSPSIARSDGTSVRRIRSASVRIATPSSKPNSFDTRSGASKKEKNTDDMISPAAAMTRPTPATPSLTASTVLAPWTCSSLTRLIRNTS